MDFVRNLDFSQQTPFGFHLYPFFEKAYEAVTGQAAADFAFVPGVTPLSTVKEGKVKKKAFNLEMRRAMAGGIGQSSGRC